MYQAWVHVQTGVGEAFKPEPIKQLEWEEKPLKRSRERRGTSSDQSSLVVCTVCLEYSSSWRFRCPGNPIPFRYHTNSELLAVLRFIHSDARVKQGCVNSMGS